MDSHPDRVAVEHGAASSTYRELETRANRVGRRLRSQGVRRGDCVAIWMPRSVDLYAAMLGILKAGAAYVPLDPDFPDERAQFVRDDCRARAIVTVEKFATRLRGFKGSVIVLDAEADHLTNESSERLRADDTGVQPADVCYVIYTSGTTGKPKGAAIEHRSACHLVRAEAAIFQLRAEDRVFQGASPAFDASIEEIWLAFFAGATLVAAEEDTLRGGDLARWLTGAGVTVLSCVPTLLTMIERDVPSIRLLIQGGESLSPDLVKRWSRPGRRIVNTYGPTEATVIATWGDCGSDKPVTIGKPVPNYLVCLLDEQLKPVPAGGEGEICLGGIGLAHGYIGRPELDREKFVTVTLPELGECRLYRTGDLGRWTTGGELEFRGRADTQVKIRGFRVELEEIEAVLRECPGVQNAAAILREDEPGRQLLAAYLVQRTGAALDLASIRSTLRARLPSYMVPAALEILDALPTLASGKVDRRRLPVPLAAVAETARPVIPPRTPLEQRLVATWSKLFAPQLVSTADDFFLDLGGHSLLAARMVSELRQIPAVAGLSMLDVYKHPTVAALAAELEKRSAAVETKEADARQRVPTGVAEIATGRIPFWRHFCCGAAQWVALFFVLTFFALQWLAPYLAYTMLIEEEYDYVESILGGFATLLGLYPLMLVFVIAAKWILIGRYRPGSYPLWGWFYFRWWLATTLEAAVPVGYLTGTPWLNIYLRLMGAKIGRNVYLGSDGFVAYDLLDIGEGTSINADAVASGYTIEDGHLKIGRIEIGRRCFIGARSVVRLDTQLQDDATLEDLSLLARGKTIPRGETWQGSPAAALQKAPAAAAPPAQRRPLRALAFGFLQGLAMLVFPALVVAALFPGMMLMNKLNYIDPYYWYLFLAPLVGVSFIIFLALEIAAVKWLLLGRVRPGEHRLDSFFHLRKWFADQTMDLSLDILGPLYASVYLAPWYRLLGAKIGRGAEVSTAGSISPDLLSIGEESFIADSVSLGAPRVRDGIMAIGRNHIGKRSFIGNSALLPPETIIGDSVLIGCLSSPPVDAAQAQRADTTWLGSPAIFLPERQRSVGFGEEQTFQPGWWLRVQRATVEFVRVILPSTCFIILISLLFSGLLLLRDFYSVTETLLWFPLLYAGCALAATAVTIIAKWLLVWRYRAGEKPLWNHFIWRNELLNALHEHVAEPFLVGALTGTPFVSWYFRLLGARIGRRVYMETTDFSEFDLVRIGDEAVLNADCTMQTHLFEDRVMKLGTIEIGARGNVGAGSLVLYDTRMEPGSALGDLSLLMKGEMLPAATKWEGIPARAKKL